MAWSSRTWATTRLICDSVPCCRPGLRVLLVICLAQFLLERFNCLNGGALLCNANTTCQPQFAPYLLP